MSKQKINRFVGSIGAFIGILVFIAYIPQIIANLQGEKAQPVSYTHLDVYKRQT